MGVCIMNNTIDQVVAFFDACKAYWMRNGDPEHVATSKAFWWDCVECWNFDRSWNDAKRDLASMFGYREGDPVPGPEVVERGERWY